MSVVSEMPVVTVVTVVSVMMPVVSVFDVMSVVDVGGRRGMFRIVSSEVVRLVVVIL